MKIHATSSFKEPEKSKMFLTNWVSQLEKRNNRAYHKIELQTSLGKTIVWELNPNENHNETLVIFPGYRTSPLFWDVDRGLDTLLQNTRLFLVETNGQANLSDGNTPSIKSLDYGKWATEVLDQLKIKKTNIAGASFGGLVCMKLCLVSPDRIKKAILLNPGCFRLLSLSFKNLYYNLLPMLITSRKNVVKFLDQIVFYKPHHQISTEAENLLIDYEFHVISNHIDKNQKPYNMKQEVAGHNVPTHLILSDKDSMMPYKKSLRNAEKHLKNLASVTVFKNLGHGIETDPKAIEKIKALIHDDEKDLPSKFRIA